MKCVLCPNEIDETREIHPKDQHSRDLHAAALEQWTQITVNVGNRQALVGHVCPDDKNATGLRLVREKASK
jgi:hypothetical protein